MEAHLGEVVASRPWVAPAAGAVAGTTLEDLVAAIIGTPFIRPIERGIRSSIATSVRISPRA